MSKSHIGLSLCLLASGFSASGADLNWSVPSDVEEARREDYCRVSIEQQQRDTLLGRLRQIIETHTQAHKAQERATALLVLAGLEIAIADADACRHALQQGRLRFDRAVEMAERTLKGQGRYRRDPDKQIAAVQRSLAQQWQSDQVARHAYVRLQTDAKTGPAFWASRLATAQTIIIDAESSAMMNRLLSEWDWIDRSRFGPRVSNFAWLLAQHADQDPELQKLALERMQAHLANGGIKPANYAYLHDRVAINAGRLQRYGTQPIWQCTKDNKLNLHPVEQPESLDARRAELAMKPAQRDLDHMAAGFCSSTEAAPAR